MTALLAAEGASGPVFEFLVLFAVVLFGPIVLTRLGLPGLIGLVLGGFAIGSHGLGLIHAGNQTVPELGQLGLLYLMCVAGLELDLDLDLQVLKEYRQATIGLGLLAFVIPSALGFGVGAALGWSVAASFLGALVASQARRCASPPTSAPRPRWEGDRSWLAGSWLRFGRPERVAMYVLTAPQAAATLAVTLIGFEIGLFGTTVVNAVLVLIFVSIVLSAVLTDKVVERLPRAAAGPRRLGASVLVVTAADGPSDAAIRAATLLARPDGGHSDLLITRGPGEPAPDQARLRAVERRIYRHGFDGLVRTDVDGLADAVSKAARAGEHSIVIVDDPEFDGTPGRVPLLVVDGGAPSPSAVVLADSDGSNGLATQIAARLAADGSRLPFGGPSRPAVTLHVGVEAAGVPLSESSQRPTRSA